MDPAQMYRTYERRAKEAVSPTFRTVNMLGMMCAAAIAQGGYFAFVGKGYGGDWPNPCEPGHEAPEADIGRLQQRG